MNCKHPEESIEVFVETNHYDYLWFCKECGSEVTEVKQYVPDYEHEDLNVGSTFPKDCDHNIRRVHIPTMDRFKDNQHLKCHDCGVRMNSVTSYVTRGRLTGYRHEDTTDYDSDPATNESSTHTVTEDHITRHTREAQEAREAEAWEKIKDDPSQHH